MKVGGGYVGRVCRKREERVRADYYQDTWRTLMKLSKNKYFENLKIRI